MTDVNISCTQRVNGVWSCTVEVAEGGTRTSHLVTVTAADIEKLSAGKASAEDLLRRTFAFLLARERKENILRHFPIMAVNDYFPEYEKDMRSFYAG